MIHILANVAIEDFPHFIGVFSTRGFGLRRKHGSTGAQLYRVSGDEHRVVILFDWESREAFEAFRADPEVRESMKAGGTQGPPEFTFLDKIGELAS